MDVDIKEEPPIEIEGYTLIDTTVGHNFGFSEDDHDSPRKKRKLSKKSKDNEPSNTSDEMQQLLHEWGLEVLCERFCTNLIDLSVLDYIVDVDIVDLCRDLPIRYRLILRHKLAEKRGKSVHNVDSNEEKGHASWLKYMNALEKSKKKPLQRQNDELYEKRDICPIEMVLNKPFVTRSEEEKRLLVSMEVPRPSMPDLKSSCKIKGGTSTTTRNFAKTKYESEWWLCGSQKRNKLFCWPCLLFTHPDDTLNAVWSKKGFNDLNHLSASLKSHRTSQKHLDNVNAYVDYGKSPATMDNETNETPSGSAMVSEPTASKPKRSIKGNSKVASNGNARQAIAKKVPKKSPVANGPLTLDDDHHVKIVKQETDHQSSKPPLDQAYNDANHTSSRNDIKQEVG